MNDPDVHLTEMDDETIDERTAAFLDEVQAAFRVTAPPTPGPALTSLFVAGLANDKGDLPATAGSNAIGSATQTAGLPNWTRRRIAMVKDLFEQVSTKVAAGAVGAMLAVTGLGATGALNAPMGMIGHNTADLVECPAEPDEGETDETTDVSVPDETTDVSIHEEDTETTVPEDDEETEETEVTEESPECEDGAEPTEEVDGEEADEEVDEAELLIEEEAGVLTEHDGLPDAPETVSEAAQIHDFDEACGNHGMYVSFFAQMGEEPPCATEARASYDPNATPEEMTKEERKQARDDAREDRKQAKAELRTEADGDDVEAQSKPSGDKAKGGKGKGGGKGHRAK